MARLEFKRLDNPCLENTKFGASIKDFVGLLPTLEKKLFAEDYVQQDGLKNCLE